MELLLMVMFMGWNRASSPTSFCPRSQFKRTPLNRLNRTEVQWITSTLDQSYPKAHTYTYIHTHTHARTHAHIHTHTHTHTDEFQFVIVTDTFAALFQVQSHISLSVQEV